MRKILGHGSIITTPGGLDRPHRPALTEAERGVARKLNIDVTTLDAAGLAAFRKCAARISDLEVLMGPDL